MIRIVDELLTIMRVIGLDFEMLNASVYSRAKFVKIMYYFLFFNVFDYHPLCNMQICLCRFYIWIIVVHVPYVNNN